MHRFDVKTIKKRKSTKAINLRSICIDLTSKRSKKLSNVPKLQKWSNYNELHRFDVKTIKNVELRRKTFKRTQNYKTERITMNCIDLMSKRSKNAKLQKQLNYDQFASIWRQNDQKCWGTSQNIQNNAKLRRWSNYNELHRFDGKRIKTFESGRKTTKVIKLLWIASIWHQNDLKCWDTSQNYKSDQIIMNCIDLTLKLSKLLI